MLQLLMLAKQDKASPTMETTALIHKVTQSFSNIMDEKLLKFSMTKISTSLESQSKPITATEQWVSDVEDMVADLETRLTEAEKKMKQMAEGMDDMVNQGRRENIRVLNLEEGMEGKLPIQPTGRSITAAR